MNPMNDPNAALQALLSGAGLKATRFPPNSRYAGLDMATMQRPDGTMLVYVRRRFIAPPGALCPPPGARGGRGRAAG